MTERESREAFREALVTALVLGGNGLADVRGDKLVMLLDAWMDDKIYEFYRRQERD